MSDIDSAASAQGVPALGFEARKAFNALAPGEPYLLHRFLPRCASCGARHPLAYEPPCDESLCPGCGISLDPPPPAQFVGASLSGYRPVALAARLLLALGRLFSSLAKRMAS